MTMLGRCPKCGYLLTEEKPVCPRDGVDRSGRRVADASSTAGVGAQPSVRRRPGWRWYGWGAAAAGVVVIILVVVLTHRGARPGGVGSGERAQGGGAAAPRKVSEIVGYEGRVAGEGKTRSRWGEIRGVRADGTTVDYNTLPQEMREEAEQLLQPHLGSVAIDTVGGMVRVARPGHGGLPEGGPGELGEQFPGAKGEVEGAGKELTPAEEERAKAATSSKERFSEEEMRLPKFEVPGPQMNVPPAKKEIPTVQPGVGGGQGESASGRGGLSGAWRGYWTTKDRDPNEGPEASYAGTIMVRNPQAVDVLVHTVGTSGRVFIVSAGGRGKVAVNAGEYKIRYVFADSDQVYEGDSFEVEGASGKEITLTGAVGGDYGGRPVSAPF